jgi:hypothetical protein
VNDHDIRGWITSAIPTTPQYDALIARSRTGAVGLTRPDR